MLWTCHLGALGIGFGRLTRSPLVVTIGVEWLVVGNIIWLVEMALGGLFLPTTLLTHVFGLIAGLIGLRTLGVSPGAWMPATVTVIALFGLTWFITPPDTRVNLTHGIRPGLERYVPSYAVYIGLILMAIVSVFIGVEVILIGFGFPIAR